jgi:hypothetical protein
MARKDPAIEAAAKEREAEMTPNPVITNGTTEVPLEQRERERFEEMERQKEEDIARLEKEGDGKPKV